MRIILTVKLKDRGCYYLLIRCKNALFKLLKPIFNDRMKIYEIEFEGKIGRPDFEFTLSRIKTA